MPAGRGILSDKLTTQGATAPKCLWRIVIPSRITRSFITFLKPFSLGNQNAIRSGVYEVISEGEHIRTEDGDGWRTAATYLVLSTRRGRTELCFVDPDDLANALRRDPTSRRLEFHSDAALPPRED